MLAFRVKKAIAKKEETTQMLRQQMLVSMKSRLVIHKVLDKLSVALGQRTFFIVFIIDFEQGFALWAFLCNLSTTKNKGSNFVDFL